MGVILGTLMIIKSKSFKKLQSIWYRKLKRSGFNDIEQDEIYLKQYAGIREPNIDENSGIPANNIGNTRKYNYYRNCREHLGNHEFKTKWDRRVFEMHSEGVGIREIAKKLKTYRRRVHEAIQRMVKEMKNG